ncbi:MAG: hypothetical protein N2606_04610 [Candidatus Omnitrophica bacterium]|nr:hypothetical protein [Candidatus Omnitrophota bacterium]
MTVLNLIPQQVTSRILTLLERKKLIKTLIPSQKILNCNAPQGALEVIYKSCHRYGSHKLICVKKNSEHIRLTYHGDNEEFILVNPNGHVYRPLYIVIALDKKDVLLRKIKNRCLSSRDFMCLVMDYHNPMTTVFTMLKDTVHCEVTSKGRGRGPVFFVSEPSRLKAHTVRTPGYQLLILNGMQRRR